MKFNTVICFDMEMCCWENKHKLGDIIEISLVEVCLASGDLLRRSQYYVQPDTDSVSDYCTSLTGITPSMLFKQGRSLSSVMNSLVQKYGAKSKVFCAWGDDLAYLKNQCRKRKINFSINHFLDLSVLFHCKHSAELEDRNKLSLTAALAHYGLDFEGQQHSGLNDAINLARIAPKIIL